MEDKDLDKLFKSLKAEDAEKIPDFDAVLNSPREINIQRKRYFPLLKWSAAAAVILIAGLLSNQQLNSNKNPNIGGETLTEEKDIMNWESETDVYLLSEVVDNYDLKEEIIITKESLNENFELENKTTFEEDIFAYQTDLSEWESSTDFLLNEDF